MNVLVAHGDPAERKRLLHHLAHAGHAVVEADGTPAARTALDHDPDVVIVEWSLPGGGARAFVEYLRSFGDAHRRYIIVAMRRAEPHDIGLVFRAGADDFVTTQTSREELLARVDGLVRVRAWAEALGRAKSIDFTRAFDLDNLRVWRELDAIVTAELGEMLGTHLAPEGKPVADQVRWTGTVPLSLSAENVEVRLGVGLELGASAAFAKEVLGGDSTQEALRDALRELANVAGGAIKRAALTDGVTITIGLPSNENLFASPDARKWSVTSPSGLRVTFAAVVLSCHARPVACTELQEGMVIARDVRNASGTLLVAAGTYLTATTVARLARFLDANVHVDVTETVPMARA